MEPAIPDARMRHTMELLWRSRLPRAARRGPPARIDVDTIVDAAITWADTHGLYSLTMRGLAARVGVKPMTLYSHVPDKATLLVLMVDQVQASFTLTVRADADWATRLRSTIEANYRHHLGHPWLAQTHSEQPPMGPGTLGKYEQELAQLTMLGLTDMDTDAVLTFALNFARTAAVNTVNRASTPTTNETWWTTIAPLLRDVVAEDEYPLATRVGTAAGIALDGAHNAALEYTFGVDRIVDAVTALRRS